MQHLRLMVNVFVTIALVDSDYSTLFNFFTNFYYNNEF
jgi:hypothetical protein